MLDTTWHKTAIVVIFGGPLWVYIAGVIAGPVLVFGTAVLWFVVLIATLVAEKGR